VNLVTRFERFVERLMEGTFTRATGSQLQPVEIGKRLVRTMESQQSVGVEGVLVPNVYDVYLSPQDYAQFKDAQASMGRNLEGHLGRTARQRGFHLMSRPKVTIHPDREVQAGDMLVEAHHEDVERPDVAEYQHTQTLPQIHADLAPAPAPAPPLPPEIMFDGQTYAVLRSPTRLGRLPDNDIVLSDKRVSRHHAEVVQRDGRWVVRDAGSTNGTAVNGKILKESVLKGGDIISLGGLEVTWRQ
jgi:Protein of unknown function (DUF3662)/FHA domain